MRVDRLLTLGVFGPLQKWRGEQRVLPVLMYHSISEGQEKGVPPYYRTSTNPRVFAEQMALLRSRGFRAVTLCEGREWLRRGAPASEKLVALTFDDGFRDFYTHAFPVLQENKFSATMFLPTAFIGDETRRFKEHECMNWGEVRELHKAGVEFGSHTVNHPKLYELAVAQIREELEVSRAVIEEKLGDTISSFAYPYAFPSTDRRFVEGVCGLLREAGYKCNVTTRIGRVRAEDDAFTLKRLPVNSKDDGALLLAKIHGGYDWLNWPQDFSKNFRRKFINPRPKPGGKLTTAASRHNS